MLQLSLMAAMLAAQAPASGATSERWIEMARPEGRTISLDLNSIRVVRGQIRSVRTRVRLNQQEAPSGRLWTDYEQDVDCQSRQMAMTGYANYRPDGSLINRGREPDGQREWVYFEPGSQGANTVDRVCR